MRNTLNMTVTNITSFFSISRQTLYNWLHNRYSIDSNNKRIFNKPPYHNNKLYVAYINNYIKTNPQFNIKILLKNLMFLFGVGVSKQTIYNILKKNNITRKRIQINKYPHSIDKYQNELKRVRRSIKNRKKRIISIDETGIHLNCIGNYGWCESNKRCIINQPHKNNGVKFSLLFAISRKKIIGYTLKTGSFNGQNFVNFINMINVPNGRYKYFLDNARIHHTKLLDNNIKNKMIYNVPYSPQFNPIEYVNNELKRQIIQNHISNENDLRLFLDKFIKSSNKKGFDNYFDVAYKKLGI